MKDKFVGRNDNTDNLKKIIETSKNGLMIQSIEGPGGIGKTALFDHVVKFDTLDENNFLVLKIDGNASKTEDIFDIVFELITSANSNAIKNKQPGQIFPECTKIIKEYKDFKAELINEFKQQNNNEEYIDTLIKFFKNTTNFGKGVNEIIPATKDIVDFEVIEEKCEVIKNTLSELKIIDMEAPNFIQRLTLNSSKINLRNLFRERPLLPLSNALFNDLSAILKKPVDFKKPSPNKIKGIDRLFIVIDDYEALLPFLSVFLTEYFFKNLKKAEFQTSVTILGRDSLFNTSTDWDQYYQDSFFDPIILSSLSKDEVFELAEKYGVTQEEVKEQMWKDTEGYPYYIKLWTEEIEKGGLSATRLKQFYIRTTKWMKQSQIEWLDRLVFLDEINEHTIKLLGFDSQSQEVNKWFQEEGSLRDPTSKTFTFRPFVKSRILEYLKISNPEKFIKNRDQGRKAMNKFNESKASFAD